MKRKKLIEYLEYRGCYLIREGGSHSVYFNPQSERISTVPRHREVIDLLAEKICKDLAIPKMRRGK